MAPPAHPPVVVLSPCLRAGTTLIQRLLCSAPDTLIYGDGVGQEMEFFARYTAVKEQMLGFHAGHTEPVRSAVLAGNTDDFITALSPPADRYVEGLKQAAMTFLDTCAQDAIGSGRPVWGWKLAGADAIALPRLAHWLPDARWIWIERDLADCFRSAKAAGMVCGAEEATRFGQLAGAAREAFAPLRGRALVLSYQEMLEDHGETVRRLEAHTGASGIREEVFQVKINSPGSRVCVAPAELTAEESAALEPWQ